MPLEYRTLAHIVPTAPSAVWPLLLVALAVTVLRTRTVKGHVGEFMINVAARWRLPAKTYRRLNNITLPTPDGTTQIDHVIVCPYGVFVIETKFMQGVLCGRAEERHWTQRIGRRSYRFQNPLRQNFKHVQALKTLLDLPDAVIHSVVVFMGDGRFKTERPANVLLGGRYVTYIKSFRTPVLTDRQVEETLQKIHTGRLAPTRATHRQHIRHLRSRLDPSAQRNCPRCGAAMVLRTVKDGANTRRQFWGCSNYPRCRVIQPMSE